MKAMILHCNAGNGHRRAAEALAKICEQDKRITEVRLVDALEYTNKVFQELYAKLYIQAVKRAPNLWAYAFDETDEPWEKEKMRMIIHRLNGLPLQREIKRFQPDLCFCTHFMPADIISAMLKEGKIDTSLSVVVTDYYVHALWLESYINRVYVAKEESKEQLVRLHFPEDRVQFKGIPIDPVFETQPDPALLRKKHGIDDDLPLVILSAGAFGVMSGADIAAMLGEIKSPCHVVVICGNNDKLRSKIDDYIEKNPSQEVKRRTLGFTSEIHEWMQMASLFIGKPGGLTTSECLACGLPMVIWAPIPGQEMFNTLYLLENNAAIAPDNLSTLTYRVDQLLTNPERLQEMKLAAKALGNASAARDIVNDAIEHLDDDLVTIPQGKKKHEQLFAISKRFSLW